MSGFYLQTQALELQNQLFATTSAFKMITTIRKLVASVLLITSSVSHGALVDRGTDSAGNKLIYDTTQNITWYDFSSGGGVSSYQSQVDWANSLTVNFNGKAISEWRLPTSTAGAFEYKYDGTGTAGFNITTSEMGNLYYISLAKTGAYDKLGNYIEPTSWLNSEFLPFQNLRPGMYWTSTPDPAKTNAYYAFYFYSGYQFSLETTYGAYGVAVHDGDVAAVPEPFESTLALSSLVILIGVNAFIKRDKQKS